MTRSTSLFARRAFATGTLLALLGAASCQTVLRHAVAGVLEAATGEQVTVHGGNGGGVAPEKAWQDMNMYGQAGDGCGFAGLRLFTFGSDSSAQITLR